MENPSGATCGSPRKPVSLLPYRWSALWLGAKLGAIRCGPRRSRVNTGGNEHLLRRHVWTDVDPYMDAAWPSTDQEVGCSSRLGRAELESCVLIAMSNNIDAPYTIANVNVLLWATIGFETLWVYDERRYRLRHDMEIEIPGSGERLPPSTEPDTRGP